MQLSNADSFFPDDLKEKLDYHLEIFRGKIKLIRNKKGVAVVEMLLLLVILIAVVLIFKEQLINLVGDIFDTILESAGEV